MHTFAIISNSKDILDQEKQKLLDKYKVTNFNTIRIEDNSISGVRNAQRLLAYKVQPNKFQALLIEHVGEFSQEAQQALLKTLEEPPINTIIILLCLNIDQLLPTIQSRAQIIARQKKSILTLEMGKEITAYWAKIIKNNSISVRLNVSSETVSKYPEREDFSNWIDTQIVFFESLLVKRVRDRTIKKTLTPLNIATILKLLLFTKKYIKASINMKLLVDHLYLNLPYLE